MCFILAILISIIPVHPSHGGELSLDLRREKVMQALGPLDERFSIPPIVVAYIEESERLETGRGQALLQLAKDYTQAIIDLPDPRFALVDARHILKSEFCVRFHFGQEGRRKNAKIHSLIFNRYENARLGIRINSYLAKALPYLPEESAWAKECRF